MTAAMALAMLSTAIAVAHGSNDPHCDDSIMTVPRGAETFRSLPMASTAGTVPTACRDTPVEAPASALVMAVVIATLSAAVVATRSIDVCSSAVVVATEAVTCGHPRPRRGVPSGPKQPIQPVGEGWWSGLVAGVRSAEKGKGRSGQAVVGTGLGAFPQVGRGRERRV